MAEEIRIARLGPLIDIGGEIFPRLSADRKTTAAFYTKPEAAELLARLCLPDGTALPAGGSWESRESVVALRVADPACGTGTLLRAAYRRIRVLHEQAGGKSADLHAAFMERGLCGVDISPIAAHLTAAGLSKMEVGQDYTNTNIGVASVRDGLTGSLELLGQDSLADLFGRQVRNSTGNKRENSGHSLSAPAGAFDFVIMNPPYSRTRGGQSAFDVAGLAESERKASQRRAKALLRGTEANLKAGLGSAFIVLADRKLKPGGILGAVLPLTAAMQQSWEGIRRLIETRYTDTLVVTLASDRQESFSADTGMGELLLVARKAAGEQGADPFRLMASLHRPPLHLADAAELGRVINQARRSDAEEGILRIGEQEVGQWVRKRSQQQGAPWAGAGARHRGLSQVTDQLKQGFLRDLDGAEEQAISLPMTTFGELFQVGPTHHLIGHLVGNEAIGAFQFHAIPKGHVPGNPALWAARAQQQRQLITRPTHQGVAYASGEQLRKMRARRSTLFYARNMRWTSQALVAATTAKLVLGGRAWTALLHEEQSVRQAFAIWANGTLGMLLHWAHGGRQQAGRSVMQVRALGEMPVPDFGAAGRDGTRARQLAAETFPELSGKSLLPACLAWRDPARQEIDQAVARMLGLSEARQQIVTELRDAWCREPTVHGNNKRARALLAQEEHRPGQGTCGIFGGALP